MQETHAHRGNQLVCVKPRQTDVIEPKNHLYSGIHGDTVSTHLYFYNREGVLKTTESTTGCAVFLLLLLFFFGK